MRLREAEVGVCLPGRQVDVKLADNSKWLHMACHVQPAPTAAV